MLTTTNVLNFHTNLFTFKTSSQPSSLKSDASTSATTANTINSSQTNASSLGVVSRLKNWINKPTQLFNRPNSVATDSISSVTEYSELQSMSSMENNSSSSNAKLLSSYSRVNQLNETAINKSSMSSMNSNSSCNVSQTPIAVNSGLVLNGSTQNNATNSNSSQFIQKYSHPITMTNVVSGAGFNPPLSIDFVCKLKRPFNIPASLEYSCNQVFQGSLLEDWLMQSLDDHLNNQQQFYSARHAFLPVFAFIYFFLI